MAIASLVLGLLGLVFSIFIVPGLLCVLGFIFGIIGVKKQKNKGLAVAGIVCSSAGIVIAIIGIIIGVTANRNKMQNVSDSKTISESTENANIKETQEKQPPEEPNEEDNYTLSQKNAIEKAKSYIKHGIFHYSRAGLIRQLTSDFDKFPENDAIFVVEYLESHNLVDWKEQAAKAAKSYMDTFNYSKDGLITQLTSEFDGFTQEEAEYGAKSVGY